MKVGDYVRNKYGIAKVKKIETKENGIEFIEFDKDICFLYDLKYDIELKDRRTRFLPITEYIDLNKIKSSPNIIDLIEVGDYVNGKRVTSVDIEKRKIYIEEMYFFNKKDIKSIVTKEQFKSMKYVLGDDKE